MKCLDEERQSKVSGDLTPNVQSQNVLTPIKGELTNKMDAVTFVASPIILSLEWELLVTLMEKKDIQHYSFLTKRVLQCCIETILIPILKGYVKKDLTGDELYSDILQMVVVLEEAIAFNKEL